MAQTPSPLPSGPPDRQVVDAGAIESVASQLLPLAGDLREATSGIMRHAPDPGVPPAPDVVVDVQGAAIDAVAAVATSLEEASALLALSARRYRQTEEEVARAIGRVGEDRA